MHQQLSLQHQSSLSSAWGSFRGLEGPFSKTPTSPTSAPTHQKPSYRSLPHTYLRLLGIPMPLPCSITASPRNFASSALITTARRRPFARPAEPHYQRAARLQVLGTLILHLQLLQHSYQANRPHSHLLRPHLTSLARLGEFGRNAWHLAVLNRGRKAPPTFPPTNSHFS